MELLLRRTFVDVVGLDRLERPQHRDQEQVYRAEFHHGGMSGGVDLPAPDLCIRT
jgi:hypothetical protein